MKKWQYEMVLQIARKMRIYEKIIYVEKLHLSEVSLETVVMWYFAEDRVRRKIALIGGVVRDRSDVVFWLFTLRSNSSVFMFSGDF